MEFYFHLNTSNKSYSLTLIDSLDMLVILGNRTEFERVVDLIGKTIKFNKDINVSVFETNIRGNDLYNMSSIFK